MRGPVVPGPMKKVAERVREGLLLEKRRGIEERFVADARGRTKVTQNPEAARRGLAAGHRGPWLRQPSAPLLAFHGASRSSASSR